MPAVDNEQAIARDYVARIVSGTGLSVTEIARQAGIAPSTLTRIYPDPQVKYTLSMRTLAKIDQAFPGFDLPGVGSSSLGASVRAFPSLQEGALRNVADRRAAFVHEPHQASLPMVPVFSTGMVSPVDFPGAHGFVSVEQFQARFGEVTSRSRLPGSRINPEAIFSIYLPGAAMEPRFRRGERVFIDRVRPPALGEDVLVLLKAGDKNAVGTDAIVARLLSQEFDNVSLSQYAHGDTFKVKLQDIENIYRIVPWIELID